MKTVAKRFLAVSVVAATIIIILLSGASFTFAAAVNSSHSGVLDDLSQDEIFDVNNYPYKADDYSLQVFQIAESTTGELLIYVYQPSGHTGNLRASRISIALEADNDKGLTPVLYDLEYENSVGVLFKYKVKNFYVSANPVRYYNLIMIQREVIDGVDVVAEGNKLEYKAYRVGQYWKVEDIEDGGVNYSLVNSYVVEILNPFTSYIRVERQAGTQNHTYYQDNHYIAFSTDWDIDNLLSATITYTLYDYYTRPGGGFNRYNDKSIQKDIYCDEINSFKQDDYVVFNWFGFVHDINKSYSWERIQTAAEFCEKSGASSTDIEQVQNCQWVIMFEETHSLFNQSWSDSWVDAYEEGGQRIDDVTILRLEFVSDGVCYNLGAVSDTVSKDYGDNVGGPAINKGLPEWVKFLIVGAVGAVVGCTLGIVVCKRRGD